MISLSIARRGEVDAAIETASPRPSTHPPLDKHKEEC